MELTHNSPEQCSICLDDINNKDLCQLNCNHSLCKNCTDNYLKRNNKTCPYCRSDIISYHHNNKDYHLIFINNDEINNDNTNLRYQLSLYLNTNRRLVQFGYFTIASLFYFVYNYFFLNYQYNQILSNYTSLQTLFNDCNNNKTELYDLLNDESRSVILYNPNYNLGQKCLISE